MIRFEEAQERLLRGVKVLAAERVAVDLCAGRVLADDIVAGFDMPAFDHTSMDGYAFAATDFAGEGPWELPVRGESAAGGALPSFERGTACRIFTGARLFRSRVMKSGPARVKQARKSIWRRAEEPAAA